MSEAHHRRMIMTGVPVWRACLGSVYIPVTAMSRVYLHPSLPLTDGDDALEQWMIQVLLMAHTSLHGME
jgi:hypothetical protein